MFRDLSIFGAVAVTSLLPFAQITPEVAREWEKLGIVGVLLVVVGFLIFEKRGMMKELTSEIGVLTREIKKLKSAIRKQVTVHEMKSIIADSTSILVPASSANNNETKTK